MTQSNLERIRKYNELLPAVEKILTDFAERWEGWEYVKRRKAFVYHVSSKASVEISTGLSSKRAAVSFQFSIRIRYSDVRKASKKLGHRTPYSDVLLSIAKERFVPKDYGYGSCIVFLKGTSELYDEQFEGGKRSFIPLPLFPNYLSAVFEFALHEIDSTFDLSTERKLIGSIVSQRIGKFRGEDFLCANLMLGQPEAYDRIIEFYNQPAEVLWRTNDQGFGVNERLRRDVADEMMQLYVAGDFPMFDFSD
jgi:hypothetical protein